MTHQQDVEPGARCLAIDSQRQDAAGGGNPGRHWGIGPKAHRRNLQR